MVNHGPPVEDVSAVNGDPITVRVTQTKVTATDGAQQDGIHGSTNDAGDGEGGGSFTKRMFIFILLFLPWYLYRQHYSLPTAVSPLDFLDHPRPSEHSVLSHVKALEDIGFRIVGLPQARQGERYVIDQVNELQRRCHADGVLICDVFIQEGAGYHMFNLIDHDVLKIYNGVRNVIFQIRAKEPPSGPRVEQDAILLAAHIDSTLPSKGAADDALGVGVMLDVARVVVDRKRPFDNSILFVWNGAEETLQDGSHLYSTQHHTAKNVRAVINLEAAGTTGGAVVFQATSREMIDVYSRMPYPRGTVIGADIFDTGIMMSDTDFVQFQRYLNISGLDMAIIGHSYFYHTQKDLLQYIEPGSAQHFADNVQVAVDYLTSPSSPILTDKEWSPPDMVYLTMYDRIFQSWSMERATQVYIGVISTLTSVVALSMIDWRDWRPLLAAFLGTPLGFIGGIVMANGVAFLMSATGHGLSWFKHEHICLFLYAPPAFLGYFGTQRMLSRLLVKGRSVDEERLHYLTSMMINTWAMIALQSYKIRSAYLFAIMSCIMLAGLASDRIFLAFRLNRFRFNSASTGRLGLGETYGPAFFGCIVVGIEGITTTLDIFVPLAGRLGKDAPAENILATISSSLIFLFFPALPSLFHRLGRSWQRSVLQYLLFGSVAAMVFFGGPWWKTYDAMHTKRTATQYLYDHNSNEHELHIGFTDLGPDLQFVESLHQRYGAPGSLVKRTTTTQNDTNWDTLYPVSSFLRTYKFALPAVDFDWPRMHLEETELPAEKGVRRLSLRMGFDGLVAPTVAFGAEVIAWSFDFPPPQGYRRHHLKIVTSVDTPMVDLDLSIKAEPGSKLELEWSAIDLNQIVPQSAERLDAAMPAAGLLMDFDTWAKEKWGGAVDTLAYGAVTGTTLV